MKNESRREQEEDRRLRLELYGTVQGVGFRPFVYRLATDLSLRGWVANSPQGLVIEVEGDARSLDDFRECIQREKPPLAVIHRVKFSLHDPAGFPSFEIRGSAGRGEMTADVPPDIATCPECVKEIFDPSNRRYRYPFTNCVNCGPRFTIIETLPYDRDRTSMRSFAMCAKCREEYEDPRNRRFHAQPNACPDCGPQLELWSPGGDVLGIGDAGLRKAATAIRDGLIVAMKGLGGFQLLADARNDEAVRILRERKRREEKPFALLFPDLDSVMRACRLSDPESALLTSRQRPIVLVRRAIEDAQRRADAPDISRIASAVAPRNPYLGVMLPYTPLHHLLVAELAFPVVATSGNRSDEPICIEERDALERLKGIADLFLVHNRPIVRHCDDSVTRVLLGRELILRRARGYAPSPLRLEEGNETDEGTPSMISVGAHLKNTVSVSTGVNVVMSQHIGDLDTKESFDAFQRTVATLQRLFEIDPDVVITDRHPDYLSTQFAGKLDLPIIRVQHHYAHIASCMAENGLGGTLLGVAWDGAGLGDDAAIWGGEFLRVGNAGYERCATLYPFSIPGGEVAMREPRRSACGALYEVFGVPLFGMDELRSISAFSAGERMVLENMLRKRVQTNTTTSIGRLFDAVASILGIRQRSAFEGQAAMELEFAIGEGSTAEAYGISFIETPGRPLLIDWRPMLEAIVHDTATKVPVPTISAKFHNTLVNGIVEVAERVGESRIVLSGGCFQNAYLLERSVMALREAGFQPFWHRLVSPNDGGISLGQIFAVMRMRRAGIEERGIIQREEGAVACA